LKQATSISLLLAAIAVAGCEETAPADPGPVEVGFVEEGLESWWDTGARASANAVPDPVGGRAASLGPDVRRHRTDEMILVPQTAGGYLRTTTPHATSTSHTWMLVGRVHTTYHQSRALIDNPHHRHFRTYLDFAGRPTGGFNDAGGDKEWPESAAPNIPRDGSTTTLAITYAAPTGEARLYRNGLLVATQSYVPTTLGEASQITFFNVASTPYDVWAAAGEWGHMLYYSRALSAEEVRTNHNDFYRQRFPELPGA
jgi:hypothetical protein